MYLQGMAPAVVTSVGHRRRPECKIEKIQLVNSKPCQRLNVPDFGRDFHRIGHSADSDPDLYHIDRVKNPNSIGI